MTGFPMGSWFLYGRFSAGCAGGGGVEGQNHTHIEINYPPASFNSVVRVV